jgi:hypothetical protein
VSVFDGIPRGFDSFHDALGYMAPEQDLPPPVITFEPRCPIEHVYAIVSPETYALFAWYYVEDCAKRLRRERLRGRLLSWRLPR